MNEESDQRLQDWVTSVVKDADVIFAPSSQVAATPRVLLYLLEASPAAPPRGTKSPPLKIALRYLVTVGAADARLAHRLITQLLFAAMTSEEFEVEAEAPPLALWTALALPPQPSFVLKLTLQRERPEKIAPLVLSPLELNASPTGSLRGVVVGPNRIPIPGARVEVPALALSAQTDVAGRFLFRAVPLGRQKVVLRISAKGKEWTCDAAGKTEPLVIQINPTED